MRHILICLALSALLLCHSALLSSAERVDGTLSEELALDNELGIDNENYDHELQQKHHQIQSELQSLYQLEKKFKKQTSSRSKSSSSTSSSSSSSKSTVTSFLQETSIKDWFKSKKQKQEEANQVNQAAETVVDNAADGNTATQPAPQKKKKWYQFWKKSDKTKQQEEINKGENSMEQNIEQAVTANSPTHPDNVNAKAKKKLSKSLNASFQTGGIEGVLDNIGDRALQAKIQAYQGDKTMLNMLSATRTSYNDIDELSNGIQGMYNGFDVGHPSLGKLIPRESYLAQANLANPHVQGFNSPGGLAPNSIMNDPIPQPIPLPSSAPVMAPPPLPQAPLPDPYQHKGGTRIMYVAVPVPAIVPRLRG